MPEPATVLVGGIALLLLLVVASLNRYSRLRQHIDDSAEAIAEQRDERDRLMSTREVSEPHADQSSHNAQRLHEQIAEAEDRLAAVNRLHAAQVRTWNRLGEVSPWRHLRPVTGWRPLPEPPRETHSTRVADEESA